MEDILQAYKTFFGEEKSLKRIYSPYRICPLGAHVDHQEGLISGFAFDKGIEFVFSITTNGIVEMASLSFEGLTTFNVQKPIDIKQNNWGDYLRGAVWALQEDYHLKNGIRGIVKGAMPIGGVSSSAALLCGFVMALSKVNDLQLDNMQIIKYASRSERGYVGLNNGILDQSCVVLCKKNELLFLDTKDSNYQLLPFGDGCKDLPFKIGVFFSGVTRKLIGTDYNLRVSECKTAAWIMEAYENAKLEELQNVCLRDVPKNLFDKYEKMMPERFARRARHFYSECDRVKAGVQAWKNGDIKKFGKLIFESCESSINNYECGSPELIALYNIMKNTAGVYGGRFSGAGFKGAFIALVNPDMTDEISCHVKQEYLRQFPQYNGCYQDFFCETSNGVDFL